MPADDHGRTLLSRLETAIRQVTDEALEAEAPPTVYKERYNELLMTAMACGELDDFAQHYYVDPGTGLLAAKFCLTLPR